MITGARLLLQMLLNQLDVRPNRLQVAICCPKLQGLAVYTSMEALLDAIEDILSKPLVWVQPQVLMPG